MNLDNLETLTVEQVAEVLGVHPESVRRWAREGDLAAMRWGRRLRFWPEAVREFQEARAVQVPSAEDFVAGMGRRPAKRPGPGPQRRQR
jgi:excisionase family DNA binding protein